MYGRAKLGLLCQRAPHAAENDHRVRPHSSPLERHPTESAKVVVGEREIAVS